MVSDTVLVSIKITDSLYASETDRQKERFAYLADRFNSEGSATILGMIVGRNDGQPLFDCKVNGEISSEQQDFLDEYSYKEFS